MHDPRRLRFVTAHYAQLQGLRLIPLAMPFLVSAAWRTGQLSWVPGTQHNGSAYWFFVMLGVALTIAVFIGRYYRVRFGWVRPAFHARDVIGVIAFLALFMASISAQEAWHPSVSIPAIVVACGIAVIGVADREPRSHYLALAAAWCIFASLGALGVSFDVRDVLLDRLIAVGLIVIGIGDHLLLRQTLEPVTDGDAV